MLFFLAGGYLFGKELPLGCLDALLLLVGPDVLRLHVVHKLFGQLREDLLGQIYLGQEVALLFIDLVLLEVNEVDHVPDTHLLVLLPFLLPLLLLILALLLPLTLLHLLLPLPLLSLLLPLTFLSLLFPIQLLLAVLLPLDLLLALFQVRLLLLLFVVAALLRLIGISLLFLLFKVTLVVVRLVGFAVALLVLFAGLLRLLVVVVALLAVFDVGLLDRFGVGLFFFLLGDFVGDQQLIVLIQFLEKGEVSVSESYENNGEGEAGGIDDLVDGVIEVVDGSVGEDDEDIVVGGLVLG